MNLTNVIELSVSAPRSAVSSQH